MKGAIKMLEFDYMNDVNTGEIKLYVEHNGLRCFYRRFNTLIEAEKEAESVRVWIKMQDEKRAGRLATC